MPATDSPTPEPRVPAAAAPLLSVSGLRKRYGSFEAVRGVDLSVAPGEVVGLIGGNGAGKTTLMRCALGISAPTAGSATIFGRPPSRAGRARIGYVAQGCGLYPDLTPRENGAFVADVYRAPAPDLGEFLDRRVAGLPLGQQRRIAFDLALAHDPELLVLDEPTSGVGPAEAARLWDVICGRADAGVGVLVTTHNTGDAAMCDRLVVLLDGRVAAEGSYAEVVGDAPSLDERMAAWAR